jgi:hypothetical protein
MPINRSNLHLSIKLRYLLTQVTQVTQVAETPCAMRNSGGPK